MTSNHALKLCLPCFLIARHMPGLFGQDVCPPKHLSCYSNEPNFSAQSLQVHAVCCVCEHVSSCHKLASLCKPVTCSALCSCMQCTGAESATALAVRDAACTGSLRQVRSFVGHATNVHAPGVNITAMVSCLAVTIFSFL